MAEKKFYVVKVGKTPGIYFTWNDCAAQVQGYPGAVYKGFKTLEEAQAYLEGDVSTPEASQIPATNQTPAASQIPAADQTPAASQIQYNNQTKGKVHTYQSTPRAQKPSTTNIENQVLGVPDLPDAYAFVDGSYNQAEKRYGYGGFLVVNGEKHIVTGDGFDEEMAAMRNVAGEISGATAAIKRARELGVNKLTIFYDYEGICQWANGNWKANKTGTIAYKEFVAEARAKGMELEFVHVKGHSGIPGNEEADKLAKEACGVE